MHIRLLLILTFLFSQVHAYTDPGSGMMLWQILLAAMAGSLFYARELIDKIKGFFTKNKENQDRN